VSAPDLDALYAEAEDEAVDAFVQKRFGTEPVHDLSGMFTGQSSLADASRSILADAPTSEPEPPASAGSELTAQPLPAIAQGPRGAAAVDDGALVDAYVHRHFPQAGTRP
jgi:hypothetical protein